MENHNIKPEKITKPIQLLAVWLIGLILMVSALLTAAGTINKPLWLPVFFSISEVSIIPLFLVLIFLLQTKFRPQMQEDEYYSKFLNSNTLELEEIPTNEILIESMTNRIDEKFIELSSITKEQITFLQDAIIEIRGKAPNTKNIVPSKELKNELKTFDKFIRDTKTNVSVNLHLDKVDEIISTLIEKNIKIDSFFGKNDKQKKPDVFLLAFGDNVDFETLKTTILSIKKYGLTHIKNSAETIKNNLYIGSYGYKTTNIAILDDELFSKIANSNSTNEISTYILKNLK
jgi:hypothetical protein